jgi:cellulose synthase/poly-beta-1,6-N-acetylglucosamine synthase-like glycosyltransferase
MFNLDIVDVWWVACAPIVFLSLYFFTQALYSLSLLVDCYLFSRPVNMVDMGERFQLVPGSKKDYPAIVLFYPVLKEQESVMRTTMIALDELEYPKDRYRVIAIPNSNDLATVAALKNLRAEFPFLELLEVPPTDHPSWQPVWDAWDANPKAYWWHHGENAYNKNLPPKKTRQLIYAFYNWIATGPEEGTLMSYTDADSCPPKDHFLAAAIGSRTYGALQAKNVAGNAGLTWASTFCALDHMAWDGGKYEHLSGDPKQPFWMLGKGLFFRAQLIYDLGSFHPWLTVEDPEIGLRLWKNGINLGVMEGSLIEEVPTTFANAVVQRKRWVAGFFQTLRFRSGPMDRMGFSFIEKIKAWLIFLPCLTMSFNCLGLPLSVWAAVKWYNGTGILPEWCLYWSIINLGLYAFFMTSLYWRTWVRTKLIMDTIWARVRYMLRVNPIFVGLWWIFWTIPLWIGYSMYRNNLGLVWERTLKKDDNRLLVRIRVAQGTLGYVEPKRLDYRPSAAVTDVALSES